jgi:hypothetical protein
MSPPTSYTNSARFSTALDFSVYPVLLIASIIVPTEFLRPPIFFSFLPFVFLLFSSSLSFPLPFLPPFSFLFSFFFSPFSPPAYLSFSLIPLPDHQHFFNSHTYISCQFRFRRRFCCFPCCPGMLGTMARPAC